MLYVSREITEGHNIIDLTTESGQKIRITLVKIDLKRTNNRTGQVMQPSAKLGIDAPPEIKIKWSSPDED
jgi:hypothetical protein